MAKLASEQTEKADTPPIRKSGQRVRQGQNISGMMTVLVASILLVAVAFGAMVMLTSQSDAGQQGNVQQEELAPAANTSPST